MHLKRLLFLAVFAYIIYRIAFSTTENKEQIEVGQLKLQQGNEQNQEAGGIISYFFSWIIWTLGLFGSTISLLWSIIGYLWQILVIIANIIYTVTMYLHCKNRLQQKQAQRFFIVFALLVVLPLIINWFIAYRQFTFNIFLPVQVSVFVDCLGNNNSFTGKSIRNVVTFVILCSFI